MTPYIATFAGSNEVAATSSADYGTAGRPRSGSPRRALHVLLLHFEPADRIGEFWELSTDPHVRRPADQLRGGTLRAVLVGILTEMEGGSPAP